MFSAICLSISKPLILKSQIPYLDPKLACVPQYAYTEGRGVIDALLRVHHHFRQARQISLKAKQPSTHNIRRRIPNPVQAVYASLLIWRVLLIVYHAPCCRTACDVCRYRTTYGYQLTLNPSPKTVNPKSLNPKPLKP